MANEQEIGGFFCLSSDQSEENDLSYWEFINPSDADSDDIDIDNLSDDSFLNGLFVSWHSSLSSSAPLENLIQDTHFDHHDLDQRLLDDLRGGYLENQASNEEEEEEEESTYDDHLDVDVDDGDDVGGGSYDLDDELVPWSVSGKLERQRIRKLGKRAFAKMNYSKKSPFLYMKPGCVHGKHGLGLKHSC